MSEQRLGPHRTVSELTPRRGQLEAALQSTGGGRSAVVGGEDDDGVLRRPDSCRAAVTRPTDSSSFDNIPDEGSVTSVVLVITSLVPNEHNYTTRRVGMLFRVCGNLFVVRYLHMLYARIGIYICKIGAHRY